MKKKLLCLTLTLMMVIPLVPAAPATVSAQPAAFDEAIRNIDFNDDWKFFLATRSPSVASGSGASGFRDNGLADAGGVTTAQAISSTFNDSSWRTLSVPHDFSVEGPKVSSGSSSQGYMQGGLGWYRKHFSLPEEFRGKKISIDFEGVYQNSIVYVNGTNVGNYPSGYTGFAYDISNNLKFGDEGENLITVKVQNMSPSGRWYTGSGITRPVHLVVQENTRIDRNGVVLTNPTLETTYNANGSAELGVKVRSLSADSGGTLAVHTVVKDGNTIVAEKTSATVANAASATVTDTVTVPGVKLWWTDDPFRYDITTELLYNGVVTDAVTTKFGFRYFKIDTAEGFFLNGKYMKIQGVDLHHDSGAVGAASYLDAYRREITVLKSMGVNAYRTSHCPPSKQMIEACSELGVVVMEEAYDGWGSAKATYDFGIWFLVAVPTTFGGLGVDKSLHLSGTNTSAVLRWSDWVTREMVLRDINQPSVVMWSIGNEVRGVGSAPSGHNWQNYWRGADNTAQYSSFSEQLDTYTKPTSATSTFNEWTESLRLRNNIYDMDPTRYIAMGGDQERTAPTVGSSPWGLVNAALDGYGLNYNIASSVDTLISRFATTGRRGTFFFESESSSQTGARGKYFTPSMPQSAPDQTPGNRGSSSYDNNFASWTMPNEYGLKKDRDRKAFLGQFIWSGFDYIGEPTPYGVYPVGVSSFGCIDTAGFPKDSYFLYRSQWTDKDTNPMAHIVPMNWNDYQIGEEVEVWVNTNAYQAELFINGRSLGNKAFAKKTTNYGKTYYETNETTQDDRNMSGSPNPGGYTSPNNSYGKLHLTWYVPFEPGELKVIAKDEDGAAVAQDVIVTASSPYTITMKPNKQYLEPDGTSLLYVECDIVDEAGNRVPNAKNLVKFDIAGNGMIFGVDNGAPESSELYKWGGTSTAGFEKNSHSERKAWMGKLLCIIKSEKGTGNIVLTASSDNLLTSTLTVATAPGSAPVYALPSGNTISTIDQKTINVPLGDVTVLPRDVKVTYGGLSSVLKKVTWDPINPAQFSEVGAFTVYGKFDDPTITANAAITVNVMPSTAFNARANIALNTAAGSQDTSSATGAIATASFTSASNYPNNMIINTNTTTYWDNYAANAQTVVITARNYARERDTVEVYWPSERTFDQVSLYFVTDTNYTRPASLKVQYWDGIGWADASDPSITWATASNGETRITFGRVTSTRVRVFMVSSNPLNGTNGRMRITQFQVYGRTLVSSATYSVSYNANGGSGSIPATSWPSGSVVRLADENAFTPPSGLVFKEWNTDADGNGTSYDAEADLIVMANTTLYAIWGPPDVEYFDVSARNIDFNDGWKFFLATNNPSITGGNNAANFRNNGLADAGGLTTAQAISPTFDDSAWRSVNLPHDYGIENPKDSAFNNNQQGYIRGGLGWYRKTFSLPEEMRGTKKISISFDGVYQYPVVYVNGELIGSYTNGYTGFAFDITDKLKFGDEGPNLITVKCQSMQSSGRWYTGSGIIRPVTLVVTDLTRILRNGLVMSSQTLETTYKEDGSAVLDISASVYSDDSNGVLEMRTLIMDGATVVATNTTDLVDCNPSSTTTLVDAITVPDVKLWTLEDPFRYTVVTEILYTRNGGDGTVVSDGAVTKFGFRYFKLDPKEGFSLNGKYAKLQGVDLHHDEGALGAAANYDALKRELLILKSMGVNSYRTSHCPPSKIVIDLCSELGILVMEEAFDSWANTKATYDFGVFFMQPVPEGYPGQLNVTLPVNATWSDWVIKEMVMRDINEPSIIMWSVGNEIWNANNRPTWYNWNDYYREEYDNYPKPAASVFSATTMNRYTEAMRLRNDIKDIDVDKSRGVVYGSAEIRGGSTSNPPNYNGTGEMNYLIKALDGVGLNYHTAPSVDYLMREFPDTFFLESEASSQTSARGVYTTPSLYNTPPNQTPGSRGTSSYHNNFETWTIPHEYDIKKDRDRKGYLGQYIWTGFDYIGEPTPYGVFPVGVSSFGTIDTAGFPKDGYFLYKSAWNPEPMAHILPMNWTDFRPGEIVEVWVNTNAIKAELFLNGVSLGVKSFDKKTTSYGLDYYETTEPTFEATGTGYFTGSDKNAENPSGYVSPNGSYGKLHLKWDVAFEPGELKAVAIDEKGDQVAVDIVKTAGPAYTITMKPDKEYILPDGHSLAYVECDIVDENGVMVPSAGNLVKFDVVGNGRIVGVDNGAPESSELYKWGGVDKNTHSERKAYNGKLLVIIQSENGTGDITLTATSENLVPTILTVPTRRGSSPTVTHPALGTVASTQEKTLSIGVGQQLVLPRDVLVTYSSGITLVKKVTWDAIDPGKYAIAGSFSVNGKFEDTSITVAAKINITVTAPTAAVNIGLSTAGAQVYESATLPLATASFTSGSNYPNNMLVNNTTSYWDNYAQANATIVYAAVTNSRPWDYVQTYWPSEVSFNQVSLYFTTNTNYQIPATLTVQYWDGFGWVDAPDQVVTKATASNAETRITFGTVTSKRVRVFMESASPFSTTTGRMRITKFETYLNAAEVVAYQILAVYDAAGRMVWTKSTDLYAIPGDIDAIAAEFPSQYAQFTKKTFIWDTDFIPLLPAKVFIFEITSIDAVSANTEIGVAPTLPSVVTARYSDGTSANLAVVWDAIESSQYASAGTFTVNGTVAGTSVKAVATITVAPAVPTGVNLLLRGTARNSYFDSTTGTSNYNGTNWVVPSQWGSPATGTTEARNAGVGATAMALKYWINAAPNSSSLRAYLPLTPAVLGITSIPAGQYRIECYARSGSTSTGQYYQLFATVNGSTQTLNITNTNTWTSRQVTVTVPAGVTTFEIGIQVTSTSVGTGAWGQFDDFSVTYLG